MRISDWSSDVCSSDLEPEKQVRHERCRDELRTDRKAGKTPADDRKEHHQYHEPQAGREPQRRQDVPTGKVSHEDRDPERYVDGVKQQADRQGQVAANHSLREGRSEEHTYALQSLMRIQYSVFCLKKT